MREARLLVLDVPLAPAEAWAFAQFLKRVGFDDYRALAMDRDETEQMRDAGEKLRAALAQQGYAPR
ncbi:MAG TPA: hypothetical protein VFR86_28160 [Burkholderiaceae bacterium]|nr:hypothetical protein [Burkholderiaceae bacterium]